MMVRSAQFGHPADYTNSEESATCGVCGAHGPVDIIHVLLEPEDPKTIREVRSSLNLMQDAIQGNSKGTYLRALQNAVHIFEQLANGQ